MAEDDTELAAWGNAFDRLLAPREAFAEYVLSPSLLASMALVGAVTPRPARPLTLGGGRTRVRPKTASPKTLAKRAAMKRQGRARSITKGKR